MGDPLVIRYVECRAALLLRRCLGGGGGGCLVGIEGALTVFALVSFGLGVVASNAESFSGGMST